MTPKYYEIKNPRGDTYQCWFKCPLDVTVTSAYFTICPNKDTKDSSEYLVHKSIGHGITDVTQQGDEKQRWEVCIAPEDTNDLPLGTYWYDLQIKFGANVVCTPIQGKFKVTYDSTREVE